MGTVIDVGFQLDWAHPVCVRDGRINDLFIFGPRTALKYLQSDFTVRSGKTYWNAVAACSSALLHQCEPEHARMCFIAAYAEYMVNLDSH